MLIQCRDATELRNRKDREETSHKRKRKGTVDWTWRRK
jgi:hypothetical protein